jgi:hypothetical protein
MPLTKVLAYQQIQQLPLQGKMQLPNQDRLLEKQCTLPDPVLPIRSFKAEAPR